MADIDFGASLGNAFLNVYMLMYTAVPGILSLLLALTPALWSPSRWTWWWDSMMMAAGQIPGAVDFEVIFGKGDPCMTRDETLAAISALNSSVSGFYGPGVYLAWLIASWTVAISSIAHSKCSSTSPARRELDLELIGVVSYPLIAAGDVIVRLIRCRIDPGLPAAVFVVVSALAILSPMKRLSIQNDDAGTFEPPFSPEDFFENKRLLTMRLPRWLGYGIVAAILAEPYINPGPVIAFWIMSFLVILYSGVVSKEKYIKDHYVPATFRPWKERVAVFCLFQVVFSVVLVKTGARSFWPETSASISDLDQATALITPVVLLILARRESLGKVFKR